MADPAYRDYAEWMERNGPIPRLVNALKPRSARPGVDRSLRRTGGGR